MEEQCRVNDILTQLMRSRQLICLMLFVEGIWMLSMGSFIFTQPNEALSPGKKGTHCFHLCDAPSTVPVLSIILNKLISGWVARNIKILLCCLLVYLLFLGLPVFGLFFFLRLRYVPAISSVLTIPKRLYKSTSAQVYEDILIAIMCPATRKRFAFGSLQHVTSEAAIRLNTFQQSNSQWTTHTPRYLWSIHQPY